MPLIPPINQGKLALYSVKDYEQLTHAPGAIELAMHVSLHESKAEPGYDHP